MHGDSFRPCESMRAHCDRVVIDRLHGHRSVWFNGAQQIAFGGETPAEAVDWRVRFAITDDDE